MKEFMMLSLIIPPTILEETIQKPANQATLYYEIDHEVIPQYEQNESKASIYEIEYPSNILDED
jgi:hypothetical protein